MKPSEITLHQSEINSYTYYTIYDFAKLVNQVSDELKNCSDNVHIGFSVQKVQLAEAFLQIMIDYLEPTNELDNNFFTIDEFYDIERHLNRLLKDLYWLNLN